MMLEGKIGNFGGIKRRFYTCWNGGLGAVLEAAPEGLKTGCAWL